jgi:hypothetical protein
MDLSRSYHTNRIYLRAQGRFIFWCKAQGLTHPVLPADIGRFLQHIARERGFSNVPVYCSAIAALYRPKGWPIDPKTPAIRRVIRKARLGMAA